MNKLTVVIPTMKELTTSNNDFSLYNYNFEGFSLVPVQEVASRNVYKKIHKKLSKNVALGNMAKQLINEDDFEYVANISDDLKKKINKGEVLFVIEKTTGETKGILKDAKSGNFIKNISLDKRELKDLGNLPELAAMQNQLNDISKQLEYLNHNIKRVEQGQYNDRYAGFFSTRQLLLESLAIEHEDLQRQILSTAIQSSNETIGKLMLTLRQDATEFLDFKLKQSVADELEIRINESLSYLNSTVQLNYIAYTILEEPKALLSTMSNYKAFLDQTMLTPIKGSSRTLAWKIDNTRKDDTVKFVELTSDISENIDKLVSNQFG